MMSSSTAPTTAYNWQVPPHSRWAFWNLRQFLPTQRILRGPHTRTLRSAPTDVGCLPLVDVDGSTTNVNAVLAATDTDAFVVVQDGAVLSEEYSAEGGADRTHALMSISKSMVGWVAGSLRESGALDLDRPVTDYVPELSASGYAGARVRDVKDMRSGVRFSEEYLDPDSDVNTLPKWLGWYAGLPSAEGVYRFLEHLPAERVHGGSFLYRSSETDVLGWVCERAARAPMADLMSELLWSPIGAEHDAEFLCDSLGTALHHGGAAVTARDLARFGQALLPTGSSPAWLLEAWAVDSDTRAAFAASLAEPAMPGGWYSDQFWFRPGPYGEVLLGLGIYGQMLYVNRRTRTVCVKLSSWPSPQDPVRMQNTIRACDAIAGALDTPEAGKRHSVRSPRSLF